MRVPIIAAAAIIALAAAPALAQSSAGESTKGAVATTLDQASSHDNSPGRTRTDPGPNANAATYSGLDPNATPPKHKKKAHRSAAKNASGSASSTTAH